jgi:hypothetical protein
VKEEMGNRFWVDSSASALIAGFIVPSVHACPLWLVESIEETFAMFVELGGGARRAVCVAELDPTGPQTRRPRRSMAKRFIATFDLHIIAIAAHIG